jgi:Spy/CpxP family protein refolding chaperone
MRITRWLLAALAIAAVALVSISVAGAQAQQQPPPPGGRMGFGPPQGLPPIPFAQLGLSDDQKQQIQNLMQQERQNPPGPGLMQLEQQLRRAIFLGTDTNASQVPALRQKILEVQAAMLDRQIAHQQKIAAILTPDQRQKVANMVAGRGRGGMGRGMGPGRGGRMMQR